MTCEQNTLARPSRLANNAALLHVLYAGRSFDISMIGFDLTPASTADEVKRELAGYLQVPDERLEDYVIDRHANGDLTIRHGAAFG